MQRKFSFDQKQLYQKHEQSEKEKIIIIQSQLCSRMNIACINRNIEMKLAHVSQHLHTNLSGFSCLQRVFNRTIYSCIPHDHKDNMFMTSFTLDFFASFT